MQLFHFIKRSQAWHDLSLPARCALIELLDRFNGSNNGTIGLGCRELSAELNCSRDTANRALHELDDAGLARPTTVGVWRGKRATEWALAFYVCNKTGELPNKSWPAWSQSDVKDAKVRPEGRKPSLSPTTGTHKPKSSMNGNGVSPTTGTHVDSNHTVRRLSARTRSEA